MQRCAIETHDPSRTDQANNQTHLENNQDLPSISVVIPVYNGERTIRSCLESLLTLDYPEHLLEIILVDNLSRDRTREIINEYPVRSLSEEKVQSSYAARNRGIEAANGEIVALTDADCIVTRDWLRELVIPFQDPAVGCVGGRVLDSQPENDVERFICSLNLFSRYEADNTFLPMLLAGSTAYRRKDLLQVGCFNEHLFTGGDIELGWRMQLNLGVQVTYAPRAIVYHVHRSTLSSMARQFRRHGYGEIFIDAMFKNQPGYRRTPRRQFARMLDQFLALFTYIRSIIYRQLTWKIHKQDPIYAKEPFYYLVAESNNLWGKILGLWDTRVFTVNPADRQWQDPG